jgi:CubicO group peptidase (beta-lactamase class C family)
MAANHVGDLFPGLSAIGGCGVGHGLDVLTVLDPVAAGLRVPARSYRWEGQGQHRWWVFPEENIVTVMLIPQNGLYVRWDFENAVRQAILR